MSDQPHTKMRRSRLVLFFVGMLVVGATKDGGSVKGLELDKRNVSLMHTENELHLGQH